MKISVTGGTGFLGSHLAGRLLADGHSVRILGRRPRTGVARDVQLFLWDAMKAAPPKESLSGADAIVHLAGEPIAQRWTREVKHRIRASRVDGTRRLVTAISEMSPPPATLVTASAVGLYGPGDEEIFTENSPPGEGFLADVCRGWEAEADKAVALGVRIVKLRIGVVLGVGGGALAQILPPFKMFVGGQIGTGRQWMSWIHLDDVTGLIRFALENPGLSGPVNATAPNPVRNSRFTRILARTLRRPAVFQVPERALRMLFGEMAEILLTGQRVLPEVAGKAGYQFLYPDIGTALKNLLG